MRHDRNSATYNSQVSESWNASVRRFASMGCVRDLQLLRPLLRLLLASLARRDSECFRVSAVRLSASCMYARDPGPASILRICDLVTSSLVHGVANLWWSLFWAFRNSFQPSSTTVSQHVLKLPEAPHQKLLPDHRPGTRTPSAPSCARARGSAASARPSSRRTSGSRVRRANRSLLSKSRVGP